VTLPGKEIFWPYKRRRQPLFRLRLKTVLSPKIGSAPSHEDKKVFGTKSGPTWFSGKQIRYTRELKISPGSKFLVGGTKSGLFGSLEFSIGNKQQVATDTFEFQFSVYVLRRLVLINPRPGFYLFAEND